MIKLNGFQTHIIYYAKGHYIENINKENLVQLIEDLKIIISCVTDVNILTITNDDIIYHLVSCCLLLKQNEIQEIFCNLFLSETERNLENITKEIYIQKLFKKLIFIQYKEKNKILYEYYNNDDVYKSILDKLISVRVERKKFKNNDFISK